MDSNAPSTNKPAERLVTGMMRFERMGRGMEKEEHTSISLRNGQGGDWRSGKETRAERTNRNDGRRTTETNNGTVRRKQSEQHRLPLLEAVTGAACQLLPFASVWLAGFAPLERH
jgi:hypothetical protein